jgi:hypothetical protein
MIDELKDMARQFEAMGRTIKSTLDEQKINISKADIPEDQKKILREQIANIEQGIANHDPAIIMKNFNV